MRVSNAASNAITVVLMDRSRRSTVLGAVAFAVDQRPTANPSVEALRMAHVSAVGFPHARADELVALRLACSCIHHRRPHLYITQQRSRHTLNVVRDIRAVCKFEVLGGERTRGHEKEQEQKQ